MKNLLTLFILTTFALGVQAQITLKFESQPATWTLFGNGTGDSTDFRTIANPNSSGINVSDSVLKFKVNSNAEVFAGAFTDSFGPFVFTQANHMVTMMVHKSVVSDCAVKFEAPGTSIAPIEIKVPNTVTGQWEMLTFDFTAAIGVNFTRLVLFPDFPATRTSGSDNYLDNVVIAGGTTSINRISGELLKMYPNPTNDVLTVEYPAMTGIVVSDMMGNTINQVKLLSADRESIAVANLSAGVYFVTVKTNDGVYTTKFVKN